MKGFAEDVACELKDESASLGEEEEGCSEPRAARAKPASCPGLAAGRRGDRAGERDLMPRGPWLALKEPTVVPRSRVTLQQDADAGRRVGGGCTAGAVSGGQAAALTGQAGRLCIVTLRLGQGLRAGWSRAPQLADWLRRVGRGPSPGLLPGLSAGGRPTWSAGGGGRRPRGQPEREGGAFVLNRASSGLGCAGVLFCLWSAGNTDGEGGGRRAGS